MMIATKSAPKRGENTWIWLLKIITGLLVFTLLFIHLVVNHLVAEGGLASYNDVVLYLSSPGIQAMETLFLIIVVSHALVGTRSVILDLNPSPAVLRAVDVLFSAVGIVSVVYGIWLMRVIVAAGTGG
jgi:succinate dehydrogenase hydrophobic anchor subunit